jgi:hypothetical protein
MVVMVVMLERLLTQQRGGIASLALLHQLVAAEAAIKVLEEMEEAEAVEQTIPQRQGLVMKVDFRQ